MSRWILSKAERECLRAKEAELNGWVREATRLATHDYYESVRAILVDGGRAPVEGSALKADLKEGVIEYTDAVLQDEECVEPVEEKPVDPGEVASGC